MPSPENLARDLDQIARVYAKDPDLVLRRRFERLHHFNLFNKHQRLVSLHGKIATLATLEQTIGVTSQHSAEDVQKPDRLNNLLNEIGNALEDFDKASLIYQRSIGSTKAPQYLLKSIKQFTSEHANRYSHHYTRDSGWDDCAFHVTPEKSFLHRIVARVPSLQSLFMKKQIKDEKRQMKDEEKGDTSQNEGDLDIPTYSNPNVQRLVDIIVNLSFCMTILVPTVALSYAKGQINKLVILGVSVVIAAVISTYLASTLHKPGLAVIAAYTAILVALLNNNDYNRRPI